MLNMPFQVPQNLLYLARTVAILSGMCAGLDPDFNVWTTLAPYAKKLVGEEGFGGLEYWLEELGQLAQTLIALPAQTSRVLTQVESQGLQVRAPGVTQEIWGLTGAVERLSGSVVFAALFLGGILLWNAGERTLSQVLLGVSGLTLLWQFARSREKK
jgi:predicted unusual protein kinase regulating ubiquinone biosynthesis (AarF/ABC1/UbiB family)